MLNFQAASGTDKASVTALGSISGGVLVFDPALQPAARSTAGVVSLAAPRPSRRSRQATRPVASSDVGGRIAAAQSGDRAALAALLHELQDPWYRFCLGMLRNPDLAADAVQETAVRFLRQLSGFRGESQLRTWSLGIALNVAREMKRKHARGSAEGRGDVACLADVLPDAESRSAFDSSDLSEQRAALASVLEELPERQREAVILRFFEDLSVDETAAAMGCAEGTVKATVHQALRSLRKRLSQWV